MDRHFSFNETKCFQIEYCDADERRFKRLTRQLQPGSALFMGLDSQLLSEHQVMRERRYKRNERASLTFRWVFTRGEKRPAGPVPMNRRRLMRTQEVLLTPIHSRELQWCIDSAIHKYVTYQAEEVMGKFLESDFGLEKTGPTNFIFFQGYWSRYETIVDLCEQQQAVITLIAPVWQDQRWFQKLQTYTTHTFTLPNNDSTFFTVPPSSITTPLPWKVAAFVADFRWPRGRGRKIVNLQIPSRDKILKSFPLPERKILEPYMGEFNPTLPDQPLDVKKFTALARSLLEKLDLPRELVEGVIECLEKGWSTYYRGFSEWYQNFSKLMTKPEEKEQEKQMRKEIEEEIKKGRVAGPFPRPPFPVPWCKKQPKVCRIFGIPKNKLDPSDPTLRIIFDKSFPAGISKNDLTPRTDAMLPYWQAVFFLQKIAQLGRNTLMFFADVKSAYKLLTIKPEEWNIQVFQIGDEFFVDKTLIFGDVAGADGWDRFMRVDRAIARLVLQLENLEYYVDNTSNLTAPLPNGSPNAEKAYADWKAFLEHYASIGMPLHHLIEPTTRTEGYLGWGIDTELMIVFIKLERREHLVETLTELKESKVWSKSKLDSLIGVLTFCATVIHCLRAPLRQFLVMQTFMEKPKNRHLTSFGVPKHVKFVCSWILHYLSTWNGEASITRLFNPKPKRTIFVDAGTLLVSEEIWGLGAWCRETGEYISVPWPTSVYEESKSAKSGKPSAPFLETYAVLTAILTLGGLDYDIDVALRDPEADLAVVVDCEPAQKILNKRWCKTNDVLNNYIAYTDLLSTKRYVYSHVQAISRKDNYGAHHLSHGDIEAASKYATLHRKVTPIYPQPLWGKE